VIYTQIIGTGSYLPEKVLTNADLEKIVETTDQWIVERTGIHRRHIAADHETTASLAKEAALRAIAAANISKDEIDLIIVATTTPDRVFPGTATLVQRELGIQGCPAFDVQAVCTGFVYALTIAERFIRSGSNKCALVIGAETMSRILDWKDRTTCVLFGDGAGAVIVKASDAPGILSSHIHADGQYRDWLTVPSGVSELPQKTEDRYVQMEGKQVFKFAVNILGSMVEETLEGSGIQKQDVDWLVPHQANIRIILATAKKLDFSMDKVIVTVADHGNTSAASIPLALDVGIRDGRIKKGDTLLLEAIGGGFTWGSILLKY